MAGLTDEQQTKLDALMAELERLPTPEAIAEAGRLRCPLPLDDRGRARMRMAIAGAIAAEKLLAYINALDYVDEHRNEIGREIFGLQREGELLRAQRSLDAAMPLVKAGYLAGRQEVDFHFFAVCAGRIERFLPIAAKAASLCRSTSVLRGRSRWRTARSPAHGTSCRQSAALPRSRAPLQAKRDRSTLLAVSGRRLG